ncbi:MAG: molybdopterin-binding protein [Mastigocoleus sp.]
MKISARNTLQGKIKKVIPGVVSTEVTLEVAPGVEITSVITKSSSDNLNLTVGKDAYVVVKATDVMIGVD